MTYCSVCNKRRIEEGNIEFEMIVNGVITQVCGDCYHEAFLRTNLKRMLSQRKNALQPGAEA